MVNRNLNNIIKKNYSACQKSVSYRYSFSDRSRFFDNFFHPFLLCFLDLLHLLSLFLAVVLQTSCDNACL